MLLTTLRLLLGLGLLPFSLCAHAAPLAGGLPAEGAPLHAGQEIEDRLESKQRRAHALRLSPGDYVRGRLEGKGMRLLLTDAAGERLRVLGEGKDASQDFMFVAGDAPPYKLEVRAPQAGGYRLQITEIVPRARQLLPAAVPDSPRLRALQAELGRGGNSDAFWHELAQAGTPLVERAGVTPPLAQGELLVTFLWRGARDNVRLFGAPSGDHDELQRLDGSDVWFRSYRLPDSSRLGYKLAPDVPTLDAPAPTRRRAILATAQRDPLNARSFPASPADRYAGESILELPAAPPQRWTAARPGVAPGTLETLTLESRILGNTREVHFYRPAGYRPGADGNALLVLFDAHAYLHEVPTPTILDNLIAAGAIPPTAAILLANPTREARGSELPPNPDFARFLAEELMPWAAAHGVAAPAERTVIAGSSYGGLAAAYAGLRHPELFGKVYSQSGSFWWSPGSGPGVTGEEPGWLMRQYAAAERKPLTFLIEAGLFEASRTGQTGILESSRHMRDVLRAKGYPVSYKEYAAGHDYLHWRGTLGEGLITLLGKGEGQAQ